LKRSVVFAALPQTLATYNHTEPES